MKVEEESTVYVPTHATVDLAIRGPASRSG